MGNPSHQKRFVLDIKSLYGACIQAAAAAAEMLCIGANLFNLAIVCRIPFLMVGANGTAFGLTGMTRTWMMRDQLNLLLRYKQHHHTTIDGRATMLLLCVCGLI